MSTHPVDRSNTQDETFRDKYVDSKNGTRIEDLYHAKVESEKISFIEYVQSSFKSLVIWDQTRRISAGRGDEELLERVSSRELESVHVQSVHNSLNLGLFEKQVKSEEREAHFRAYGSSTRLLN